MGACLDGCSRLLLNHVTKENQFLASDFLIECAAPGCGVQAIQRKLIFLDVDGPLACWHKRREHAWCALETLDDTAYYKNLQALLRIIDGAGGVEVVKVVISSNWRTDERKFPWLVKQLSNYGVEVVGHTDVIKIHPSTAADTALSRDLEIQRVLKHRIIGAKGPYQAEHGKTCFELASLPESWEVTHWISIDDLDLTSPPLGRLRDVHYLSRFMPIPADPDVGNGWMSPPHEFEEGMSNWLSAFASSHFVRVNPERGLGGTHGVEARAIRLLGGL